MDTPSLPLFSIDQGKSSGQIQFKGQGNILRPLSGETPKIHSKGGDAGKGEKLGPVTQSISLRRAARIGPSA